MNYIIYCALDPTLTLRLDDYGIEQSTKGLIYSIMPTMYMTSTFLTPCVLPKWMEVRVWLIFAAIFLGISVTIVGPFFLDESLVVMCIGLFFTGSMLGPLIIPNMSEMIVAAQLTYPDSDHEHANSLIAGILTSSYGLGGASGPLIGTVLYDHCGFRVMCDCLGGLVILYGIFYFFTCNGFEAISSTCARRRNKGRKQSEVEVISEVAHGIRHSSRLFNPVISQRQNRAMSTLSWIKRS